MIREPERLVGTTLGGKYRLDELLGAGAFGAVFRGWHLRLDLPVAVKVAFRVEGAFGKRFRREARTLMRLHHPHIVRVYDYDREPDGLSYLVQEFVAGRTLKAVLADVGPLPPAVVVEIGCQTLSALAVAHAEGIVHRDVKLENLMLAGDLVPPSIRLLDFGVAKLRQGDAEVSELTQTGGSLGTPAYMAPEQIRGEPVPSSDLYAVGVTLYYLLTGRRPFPQRAPEVYLAHMTQPPPPLPPSVPEEVARVVHRALAKTPEERHASALEMMAALGASLPTLAEAPFEPVHARTVETPAIATTLRDDPPPAFSLHTSPPEISHTSAEMRGVVAPGAPTRRGGPRNARWGALAVVSSALVILFVLVRWLDGGSAGFETVPSPAEPSTIAAGPIIAEAEAPTADGITGSDGGADGGGGDATVEAEGDATVARVVDAGPTRDGSPPIAAPPTRRPAPARRRTEESLDSLLGRADKALAACRCAEAERLIDAARRRDPAQARKRDPELRKKCKTRIRGVSCP
ncbi:MAG: serine/threonine-protein kinase [bacterium]